MADNELSDTYETATTPNASEAADARSDAPQVGRAFADTNAAPEEGAIPDDKEDLNASPSSSSAIDPNSSNANNSHPSVPSNSSNIIGSAHIRPIFLGNLDMNVTAEDISDLFTRPALNAQPMSVERVDLKRGFAFVFMNDAQTQGDKDRIEQYVDGIQGMEFSRVTRALRVEFARGDGRIKRKEDDRRKNIQPNETLFVVNFSEETTKREDLEMLFSKFGELVRIDMKRNYAFVQFTTIEDSTKAKNATNGGKLDQNVITVEYVSQRRRDDDHRRHDKDRRGGRGDNRPRRYDRNRDNDRDRDYDRRRSPPKGRYGRSRSRSPGAYRPRSRSRSPPMRRDFKGRGRYDDDRGSSRDGGRDRDERGYR